jgi:alanine-glyoxylate transaminase/serine-glyoxylate transaminase/serine-pyruvate transaminase
VATFQYPGVRFLHSPGPTFVPKAVLDAMSNQPMDTSDPRGEEAIQVCEQGIRALLNAKSADVFLYGANGHGAWEAANVNIAGPGQSVLVIGTGHFSESWAVMAEGVGINVVRTPYRVGYTMDIDAIEHALKADTNHEIVAVFAVHTDTASSTTNDIALVRQVLDATKHPALLVVDVVASFMTTPFSMDAGGANVVVGATQKGLMTAPGLAFCAVDERALKVSQANPMPRFYWDWVKRKSTQGYGKFCGTPPQNLILGLEASLSLIDQEGPDNVFVRHRRLSKAVQAAVSCWSQAGTMDFVCKVPEARSAAVTAIQVSPDIDPEAIRKIARSEFNVALAGGLGPFAGKVFRIGHLGSLNEPMILGCLAGVEATFHRMGIKFTAGGVNAAIEALS